MVMTSRLQMYTRGVLTEEFLKCSDPKYEVNHGVVIVGYGRASDAEGCQEYWVVQNSWGSHWGEDGFFRLCADAADSMPFGTCHINEFAAWPLLSQ